MSLLAPDKQNYEDVFKDTRLHSRVFDIPLYARGKNCKRETILIMLT